MGCGFGGVVKVIHTHFAHRRIVMISGYCQELMASDHAQACAGIRSIPHKVAQAPEHIESATIVRVVDYRLQGFQVGMDVGKD
jgi:hypothetical protein